MRHRAQVTTAGLALTALTLLACEAHHGLDLEDRAEVPAVQVEVVQRTPYLETFSCVTLCHSELEPNATERPLTEFHTTRFIQHGPAIGWCEFCHDIDNYDQLCLLGGGSATFDESYRLCAQCHGERYADWQHGIHGLQTGSYRGVQLRRSCTFCHDPHTPGVPHVEAMPAPAPVVQPEGYLK